MDDKQKEQLILEKNKELRRATEALNGHKAKLNLVVHNGFMGDARAYKESYVSLMKDFNRAKRELKKLGAYV